MLLNRYPWWKNLFIIFVVCIGFIYAAPNLYGEDPAVQVTGSNATISMTESIAQSVQKTLHDQNIPFVSLQHEGENLLLKFTSTDIQLKAKEAIQLALGEDFLVALNLAPATPNWLKAFGAAPMKLGLDLRGGVHFLLQVDVDSVLRQRVEGDLHTMSQQLREQHLRYSDITRVGSDVIRIHFRDTAQIANAQHFLALKFTEFTWSTKPDLILEGLINPQALQSMRQDTLEQAMNTLRNRVNELGVSEAVVQQQGATRVSIDLPGIQNTTEAKDILGKTATLEFHMLDQDHDPAAITDNIAPPNTHLFDYNHYPVLLKNDIILRGSSITNANSGFGEDGRPAVSVRLGGGEESLFEKTTSENIGKSMAIVYVEVKSEDKKVDGKNNISYQTLKKVISVANIRSALGNNFQITGLTNRNESRTLALLLRAGALPAPVTIIEERQVGPSLGKKNIRMGLLSIEVGFLCVVIFMMVYYGLMGLFANIALFMNLILIVALLSMLGATLTLPGIAGMVLTVGMAVDANVLIFERIREELRNHVSIQASIHSGYERALTTIIDANLTTLIVAIVLFSLGSGAVKGFAVTLTIGLITSMFTAITGTRAMVNWIYGAKPLQKISIGI